MVKKERDIHDEWGVLVGTLKSIESEVNSSGFSIATSRIKALLKSPQLREILENI